MSTTDIPGPIVPVVALVFLLGLGCWLLSGRQLAAWTLKPLLCSWSAIWALAAEFIAKEIFGRAWPDPSYVQNHLYGFRLPHGSPHWNSFPSGHWISDVIAGALLGASIGWMTVLLLGSQVLRALSAEPSKHDIRFHPDE